MANTATMTVRIDRDLLRALKMRAKSDGRSLSAEVVQLLGTQVPPLATPARGKLRKRTMGMFAHRDSDDLDLAAFDHHRAASR